MVIFGDLLVDKSLHGQAWRLPAARSIFITSYKTYSFVTLTIDDVNTPRFVLKKAKGILLSPLSIRSNKLVVM